MAIVLKEEVVKIIGATHWVSKKGLEYVNIDYKNINGFSQNVFINKPNSSISSLAENLDNRMWESIILVTSIAEIDEID